MGNGRKPCCDKAGVKKGPWSQAEDLKLISFIQKHGHNNWRALPKLAGLARCGKSCRLRWVNYLRPDLKRGNFTLQEEEAIIKLHKAIGNKWSKIASHFPGRTDNEIKNVWNTHLKKRIKAKESSSILSSSVDPSLNEVQGENNKGCSQEESSIQQTSPVRDETVEHSSSSSTSYSSQASFSSPHLDKGVAHSNMVEIVSKENEIDIGVNKINEDSLEELIDIPFEPNLDLWDLLDGDSNSFESEVQFMNDQVILEAPSNPTTEIDKNYNVYNSTNREDGSSWWWLVYLENELGLVHSDSTPLQTTSGSSEEFWFNKEDVYFQTSPTKFT